MSKFFDRMREDSIQISYKTNKSMAEKFRGTSIGNKYEAKAKQDEADMIAVALKKYSNK